MIWQRIAAIGWGLFYSVLLHFILIITEKKRLLKKKWIYILLYMPAVFVLFNFSFISELAAQQYNLVFTDTGWINFFSNNIVELCFYIYYAGFTLTGIGFIWHWGYRNSDKHKKTQAFLLVASFIIAFILGTFTDFYGKYQSVQIPEMSSIIIIVPILSIFLGIKKYGMMKPIHEITKANEDKILSQDDRQRIYHYYSMLFKVGSFLNFASYYFIFHARIQVALLLSLGLFLVSICINFIMRIKASEDNKETYLALIVCISILLINEYYIDYSNAVMWAISFIFLIVSVLFNRQRVATMISIISVILLISTWIRYPAIWVFYDASVYLGRIVMLLLGYILAVYVHKVYIRRLKENEEKTVLQQVISHISGDFVTVTTMNIDEKINGMLEQIGKHQQADRVFLLLFSQDQQTATYSHEWCNTGIAPGINNVGMLIIADFPWWMDQFLRHTTIIIPEVKALPPEARLEQKLLHSLQVQSMIALPMINKCKMLGFLGCAIIKPAISLREDHYEMLRILANLLADALVKVEAEKEISYMAYYDRLTGLPNRQLLNDRLENAIKIAARNGMYLGVIFLDLDSFKSINDTLGHATGDIIIQRVAKNLSENIRRDDTVCRFSGDEFLILIPQIIHPEDIAFVVKKIVESFNHPITFDGHEFFVTASAGISIYPNDGEDVDALIKNADLAMYESKSRGKGMYTFCSTLLKDEVNKKMHLTNLLHRAQERNELFLHYQPQIDIKTKKIIGLEALVRWQQPSLGMISPLNFISIAEQTGLIIPIGKWILQTACQQNKTWQDMGLPPVRIAVNLSIEQFHTSNLCDIVKRILTETGLEAKYLELEITEGTATKELKYITDILLELKALGLTVSIDDFGTEYSSLSRFVQLPIDRIKMAMEFVQAISRSSKDAAIAKVIINLAKSLDLKIIAEGVETEQQLLFLTDNKCDEIQGYYFYKPMPASEIETLLYNQMLQTNLSKTFDGTTKCTPLELPDNET